jgi:hypothetical protein
MSQIALYAGVILIFAGFAVWVWRPDSAAQSNTMKFAGFEFALNTPALAVMAIGIVVMIVGLYAPSQPINFRCGLSPGFTCQYAVYEPNGKLLRRFALLAGEDIDVDGISDKDLYCVSTEPPPTDMEKCTLSNNNPWRLPPRLVGRGDGHN